MRIRFLKILFLFFFAAISLRLFYWQVVKADELSSMAEKQHFKSTEIQASRGDIYFSDGTLLAGTKPTFTLFAQPKLLTEFDRKNLIDEIAPILKENSEPDLYESKLELGKKINQDLFWIALDKNISFEQKEKIEKLNLKAIGFDLQNSRFYPEGSSSAHLLGFVGLNNSGETTGYFGIEGYYDGELKGLPGFLRHEKDALGLPILIGSFFKDDEKNGKDLVLNVDRFVQYSVENVLKKGIEKYGAKAASAIVMDPKTGAILALATYPNYDPGNYTIFPKEYFKNPIVADTYEPGSTFKVLVMAAALNEKLIKPDTKCDICDRPVSLSGFVIRTWNNKYYKDSTMTDVIVHSDNTGMVYIANKLGLDKFYNYIESYGFGRSSNVDLQDETSLDMRQKEDWKEIDLATASFGQGIAVTPIQMITAVSIIANGGFLMEPHIVKAIKDEHQTIEIKPKTIKRIISMEAANEVKEMMVKAVDDGEARVFKPKGYKIAGKTGTAQIPVAGHYDPEKTIASFVGFAPADDPKFIMLVRYDQPTSSIFGSETAAPTFFEIAKDLLPYFKIPPTE